MILRGRAIVLGAGICATDIVGSRYDKLGLSGDWKECAKHLLEDVDPAFAGSIRRGDLILAGSNFGSGHAHYHLTAIQACRYAGIQGMFAESINGLFQRAAIDHGCPAWQIEGIGNFAQTGDQIEIDLEHGNFRNLVSAATMAFRPVSPIILSLLAAGGTLNRALQRIGQAHLVCPAPFPGAE